jgi:hypothetical protein
MKIDDEFVLPCDFVVGHMHFRKGVKLETVRQFAERSYKIAVTKYFNPDPLFTKKIDELRAEIDEMVSISSTRDNGAA